MADDNLQAEWDAAIAGGDLATLERVGPLLYPEDGAASVAPSQAPPPPDASTRELDNKLTALRNQMMTSSAPALQEELYSLLQQRWPEGSEVDPNMTRAAWRPDLPPGYTWDVPVVAGFEDTAPGGQTLMHVVADTLRSSARRLDVGESWSALEQRHGEEEADALLRDADAYARTYLPARVYADLKEGKLISPELIYRAALFWRQRVTGRR